MGRDGREVEGMGDVFGDIKGARIECWFSDVSGREGEGKSMLQRCQRRGAGSVMSKEEGGAGSVMLVEGGGAGSTVT